MKFMKDGFWGKYRSVVISVAMFIILDAGVLVLNFIISSQLSEDASNVNLAGRQRMLSQKITKSLYDYKSQYKDSAGDEAKKSYEEMMAAVALFDKTLLSFDSGGYTTGASNQKIYVEAAPSPAARLAIGNALSIWEPLRKNFYALGELSKDSALYERSLEKLTVEVREDNLKLLKLMNDLTNELEAVALNKSNMLRMIQAGAITLAILNFFLILFHFIGQLKRSDVQVDLARRETTEILNNVREGLFLVDSELTIGGQYSKSAEGIFNTSDFSGESFRSLLKKLVSEKVMETAEEYILLLLNPQVKESLVGSLNPLNDVEVSFYNKKGTNLKHLSFRFNRTIFDGEVKHILVTVLDITELVHLRKEIDALHEQEDDSLLSISSLQKILSIDKDDFKLFVGSTVKSLNEINDILKSPNTDQHGYLEKIVKSYRVMHKIKGEAGAIGFSNVVKEAHDFEDQLSVLKEKEVLSGEDFLSLTLKLKSLFSILSDLDSIVCLLSDQLQPGLVKKSKDVKGSFNQEHIQKLAQRIASEQGKKISLAWWNIQLFDHFNEKQKKVVQDCLLQLIRNAVVHGVELPEQRIFSGKSEAGNINVTVIAEEAGLRISVRDDGKGIDLSRVKEVALKNKLYTAEQLDKMDAPNLLGIIFEQGFSTRDETDEHAGRGVGMDVVKNSIQNLHGRIRVDNRFGHSCDISILIPHSSTALHTVAEVL